MNTPLTVECEFHFDRWSKGARKVIESGPARVPSPARAPRIARFMALAIQLDKQMKDGVFATQTQIGELGQVTRARVSQIMGLLNLATDIQEAILFLPLVERGRAPIILRDVLPITAILDWAEQRKRWKKLTESD